MDYRSLYKRRMTSALVISLLLHVIGGIIFMLYPRQERPIVEGKTVYVESIEKIPPFKPRRPQLKEPLRTVFNPNKPIGRRAERKLSKASPGRITEVIEWSPRIPYRNVEIREAEPSDVLPLVMTEARLNEPDLSPLPGPVSVRGRGDGRGIVTGRVRVPGGGSDGLSLVDSDGTSEEGLLGGAGPDASEGVADDLGMIKFIDEGSGPQRVVYCLDISSSMGVAGLNKLPLAIKAIRASLLNLDEEDSFNIVVFTSYVKRMSDEMLEANMRNIDKAFKFLREFLVKGVSDNLGTDLLGAVLSALEMDPTVVVLVTDGLPTPGGGRSDIVTDADQIVQSVIAHNRSGARIYAIGLEMDLKRAPGAILLRKLARATGGRFKNVTRAELLRSAFRSSSLP